MGKGDNPKIFKFGFLQNFVDFIQTFGLLVEGLGTGRAGERGGRKGAGEGEGERGREKGEKEEGEKEGGRREGGRWEKRNPSW